MTLKDNFRITFNGYEYRVEEQTVTFWRKKVIWKPTVATNYLGGWTAETFHTYAEAGNRLKQILTYRARESGNWRPV